VSTLSVDAERYLVFHSPAAQAGTTTEISQGPTTSGRIRSFALKASTGEFVWDFQVCTTIFLDYRRGSQPTLFAWKDGAPAIADHNKKWGRVLLSEPLKTERRLASGRSPLESKANIPG